MVTSVERGAPVLSHVADDLFGLKLSEQAGQALAPQQPRRARRFCVAQASSLRVADRGGHPRSQAGCLRHYVGCGLEPR